MYIYVVVHHHEEHTLIETSSQVCWLFNNQEGRKEVSRESLVDLDLRFSYSYSYSYSIIVILVCFEK